MTHTGGPGKSCDIYVWVWSIELLKDLVPAPNYVFVSLPLHVNSPWRMARLDNTDSFHSQ